MREHFDQWDHMPEAHRGENFRAKVSCGADILILAAWCVYLAPWFFALIFMPGNLSSALFIVHFKWVTHNGPRGEGFKPVNLNHGYFWLGNKLFAGIYMHANHHRSPYLYNPALWCDGLLGATEPCVDARASRKVTLRGAGRSFDDQAMNRDLVIDVSGFNQIISLDLIKKGSPSRRA